MILLLMTISLMMIMLTIVIMVNILIIVIRMTMIIASLIHKKIYQGASFIQKNENQFLNHIKEPGYA